MAEESLVSHQILEIGKNVIPSNKFDETMILVKKSYDVNNLEYVAEQLWRLVNYRIPVSDINAKQLLDYIAYDLVKKLDPRRMREICEVAVESIEVICKTIWNESRNSPHHSFIEPSFGLVAGNLRDQQIIDLKMINDIIDLNDYVFNPAKHIIKMTYSGRKHFFSIQDTIMILYIVAALTRKLIPMIKYDYDWKCKDRDWNNVDETKI